MAGGARSLLRQMDAAGSLGVRGHLCAVSLGKRIDPFTPALLLTRPFSGPCLPAQTVVPFYNLGLLMALFSPRCTDSLASVRRRAVDCVYALLYIQLGYEGTMEGGG